MYSELERMEGEVALTYFKLLPWLLSEQTYENCN